MRFQKKKKMENETFYILDDFEMTKHVCIFKLEIQTIVIVNKKKRDCHLVKLTMTTDSRVKLQETYKLENT